MFRTALSVLLVASVCFGATGTRARPLLANGRGLRQTYVSFPGGYVHQDGGNVQVQYPGGSTQTAASASSSPSPSPSNKTSASSSPSPSPVNVRVAAPYANVAVNSGRKLQQTDVTFPGGSVTQSGGNVQVQYPGGSTQVQETTKSSPGPSTSTSSSTNTSASPVNVTVTAPDTNVAVNTGRKLQQTDVSFPGGYVSQNGGNVQVQYPGGNTQVQETASPSPSPSPSASNTTSPSPSPSTSPVNVSVIAPDAKVAVNAGRKLHQTDVTFPGGSVSQSGGNVQVQYPGGTTQVEQTASPSPSPSPSPSLINDTSASPSPSPTPVSVGVTAPDTNVAVNTGRKLQQTDVTFPGGSVSQNGGNVHVEYPGGSTQVAAPSPSISSSATNATSPAPSASNTTFSSPSPSASHTEVGVAAPGTQVSVNTGGK